MLWSAGPRYGEDDLDAKAEPSLLDRCREALAVLERHGVDYVSLLERIENGHQIDGYVVGPRLSECVRFLKKHLAEICNAVQSLQSTIAEAIEADLKDDVDDEFPTSFYAYVSIRRTVEPDAPFGWSIYCSVTATIDDDYPDIAIKLR